LLDFPRKVDKPPISVIARVGLVDQFTDGGSLLGRVLRSAERLSERDRRRMGKDAAY
jgi:hypothetical protein